MFEIAMIAAMLIDLVENDYATRRRVQAAKAFYRTLIDIGREERIHNVENDTPDHAKLLDTLEYLGFTDAS